MNQHNLKKTFNAFFPLIVFILVYTNPLLARMEEVSDSDLSQVSAQAGITYNFGDSQLLITCNSIAISDTDNNPVNWLELNNITISGPGGYFSLDEAGAGIPGLPFYFFNTIDIATVTTVNNLTMTVLSYMDSTNTTERDWTIGDLVFCNQDLGSLQFDERNVDPTLLYITGQGAGASGIEFEYRSNWRLNNFTYNYNTSGGSLNIAGINIAGSATGAPENPSTWAFSGQFLIGDIIGCNIPIDNNPSTPAASNPATFNVLTVNNTTSVYMNLPMEGTIRAADVNFGGTDFGPVAIDGITVHHLYMTINPGK